jgi:hypothetical protein
MGDYRFLVDHSGRSNTGVMGLSPTQGMDIWMIVLYYV